MTISALELDKHIDATRNTIRTDKLDITYGELATMYEGGELKISPEYQRLFRWNIGQKTRFVETMLLGIPTPAIFVAEDDHGRWELVDGLQRISTVLEFMGLLRDPDGNIKPPSKLEVPSPRMLLAGLDGFTFEDLSYRSKMTIKRASCRVEVIKVGSKNKMKYEVFERLNTGGAVLTHQEIRNCIFRATDPGFMDWVDDLARHQSFADNLGLSELQRDSMFDRGLVLRYFTMKNAAEEFDHDVEPFITDYVRGVLEGKRPFERTEEARTFRRTFDLLGGALSDDAWRHYRDGRHRGAFSVYLFDVLSVGVARNIDIIERLTLEELRQRCVDVKTNPEFIKNTGPGANTKPRTLARFAVCFQILGAGGTTKKPAGKRRSHKA
ncbi:DUF262 domain-containing protein [Polyangium spumosum]|nr:DUF262 domain-containing protein [Polyangium spumosum]